MNKKLIYVLLILFILGIGYGFSIKNIETVKLNEEITVKRNQKVKLENEEVYFKIKRFINSPAPEGATSIWSGLAVIYEMKIDGNTYKTDDLGRLEVEEKLPYDVDILETDFKTFAKIKFVENN